MAWSTMHFAVGMGCAGAAATVGCMMFRRGWRWIPGAMTLGGIWALLPDAPRIFREDFYWEPISSVLGTYELEHFLHQWGDLFFFHGALDAQPRELALLGMLLIVLMYNAGILLLMRMEHKNRHSLANRAWQAHRSQYTQNARCNARRKTETPSPTHQAPTDNEHESYSDNPDVIYRIGPRHTTGTDDHSP